MSLSRGAGAHRARVPRARPSMQRDPASRQVVRFAIVGSGSMARTRAANIAAAADAELIGVSSRNQVSGQQLAMAHHCAFVPSLELLLARSEVDAVIVCTHNAAHAAAALAALREGRHVLVEYPLSLDAVEAAALAREAAAHNVALAIGYDQQYLGPHAALQQAVRQDGPPLELAVRIAWPGGSDRTPFRNAAIGGVPALVKSWYLYAALDLLGIPRRHRNTWRPHALADDHSYAAAVQHIELEYPESLAKLAWVVGPPLDGRQRGEFVLTWPERTVCTDGREVRRRDAAGQELLPVRRLDWREATQEGVERFVRAVRGERDAIPDVSLAAATVRLAMLDIR